MVKAWRERERERGLRRVGGRTKTTVKAANNGNNENRTAFKRVERNIKLKNQTYFYIYNIPKSTTSGKKGKQLRLDCSEGCDPAGNGENLRDVVVPQLPPQQLSQKIWDLRATTLVKTSLAGISSSLCFPPAPFSFANNHLDQSLQWSLYAIPNSWPLASTGARS